LSPKISGNSALPWTDTRTEQGLEFKVKKSQTEGISLIEVVLILAVALILGAALIPRMLNSRILANEAAAVANVDVITSAQESYRSAYPAIGYAGSLSALALVCGERNCKPTPEHACLIDCNLPKATVTAKDGFFYQLAAEPSVNGGPNTRYGVGATAAILHRSGDHDYCAVEDAKIRYRVPATASAPGSLGRAQCISLPVMP
jgi:type II secretory pathway pseudopilin PulG